MRIGLLLIFSVGFLSACSVFSPVKTESVTTYLIDTVPQPVVKRAYRRINLLVTQPEASSLYNTTAIAYTTQPHQIGYFVKSAWAETPPQMLQPLIIQTLQRTKHFHSVGTISSVGQYNYILNTQLLRLQEDFTQRPAILHFVLRAQLLKAGNNQVIASREFSVHEPVQANNPALGIRATNRAAAQILSQLAHFCVRTLR